MIGKDQGVEEDEWDEKKKVGCIRNTSKKETIG